MDQILNNSLHDVVSVLPNPFSWLVDSNITDLDLFGSSPQNLSTDKSGGRFLFLLCFNCSNTSAFRSPPSERRPPAASGFDAH